MEYMSVIALYKCKVDNAHNPMVDRTWDLVCKIILPGVYTLDWKTNVCEICWCSRLNQSALYKRFISH